MGYTGGSSIYEEPPRCSSIAHQRAFMRNEMLLNFQVDFHVFRFKELTSWGLRWAYSACYLNYLIMAEIQVANQNTSYDHMISKWWPPAATTCLSIIQNIYWVTTQNIMEMILLMFSALSNRQINWAVNTGWFCKVICSHVAGVNCEHQKVQSHKIT